MGWSWEDAGCPAYCRQWAAFFSGFLFVFSFLMRGALVFQDPSAGLRLVGLLAHICGHVSPGPKTTGVRLQGTVS